MPQGEEAGQPRRFCRNCGAEVRPGDAFCASCGVRLDPEIEDPDSQASKLEGVGGSEPSIEQGTSSPIEKSTETGPKTNTPRLDYGKAYERIKDLPVVFQVVLGLGLMVLLGLLIPVVGAMAFAVLFGVSLIGLIVRVGQRRMGQRASFRGWGILALASLAFIVVYGPLYDSPATSTGSRSNKNATEQAAIDGKNTQALREAAYRRPPFGVKARDVIDDLQVTGGTAKVKLVGLAEPGDEFGAAAERVQAKETCGSLVDVAAKNEIPIDKVEVVNVRGEKVADCGVKKQETTTGKTNQKQKGPA